MTMTTIRCQLDGCDRLVYARGACSPHYQRYLAEGRLDELSSGLPEVACATCGTMFRPKYRRQAVTWCSKRCKDAARPPRPRVKKPAVALNCWHCGQQLVGKRANARFCNATCSHAWNYERRVAEGSWRPSSQAVGNTGSCEQCGKSLAGKRSDATFCSEACSQLHGQRRRENDRQRDLASGPRPACQTCGVEIPYVPHGQRSFCSAECRQAGVRPRKYGLTKLELDALMESQGQVCAICHTDDWGAKGPHIDHCHDSGKVRGVLCNDCNAALGRLHDSPERGRSAIAYLERHAVT